MRWIPIENSDGMLEREATKDEPGFDQVGLGVGRFGQLLDRAAQ